MSGSRASTVPVEWLAEPVSLAPPPGLRCRYSATRSAGLVRHCRDAEGHDTTRLFSPPELDRLLNGDGVDARVEATFPAIERAVACLTTFSESTWRWRGADEVGGWVLDDGRSLMVYAGTEKEVNLGEVPAEAVASAHTHSAALSYGAGPNDANAASTSGLPVYIVSPYGIRAITPATAGYWHYMMHAKRHRKAGQPVSTRNWRRHFGSEACEGIQVVEFDDRAAAAAVATLTASR